MTPLDIMGMGRVAARAAAGPPATNLLKQWKLNTGLTQAGGFASAWADQIAGTALAQATGNMQPAVQGDGSLLFDGVNDTMQVSFTLNQPYSTYVRAKVVAWSVGRYIIDGSANYSTIFMTDTTPQIAAYAGTNSSVDSDLTVGTKKSVCGVFNGASSALQVSGGSTISGDFGALNAGGISLANIHGNNTTAGNVQIYEVLVYNVAHDATQRAAVFVYLDAI